MSSIYLLITLSFIVILVRQDQREWPQFSFALWIPILWLVSSSTRLVGILFGGGRDWNAFNVRAGLVEGNPIGRMVSIVLILLGIVVFLKRKNAFLVLARANRGIFILYAYALISIVWSDYPGPSINKYIRLCGSLLMAFIVTSEEDHHKALEHVFRRYAAICVTLSLLFIRTDRSIGYVIGVHGAHSMAGITQNKNELGILCAFCLVFLVWRSLRLLPTADYFDVILILINIYLLIRAQSAAGLVVALMGITLIIGIRIARGSFRRIVILVMILAIVTLPILIITMNSPGGAISGLFYKSVDRDTTLTGRIPLWNDLIRLGKKNIIQGSGYESFWIKNLYEIWEMYSFGPNTAHNGFVDVLLNLGLIGLAIVIVIISRLLFILGSKDSLSQPYGVWNFVVLIMIILHNITESSLMTLALGWSLFLIILANNEKDRLMRLPSMAGSSSGD